MLCWANRLSPNMTQTPYLVQTPRLAPGNIPTHPLSFPFPLSTPRFLRAPLVLFLSMALSITSHFLPQTVLLFASLKSFLLLLSSSPTSWPASGPSLKIYSFFPQAHLSLQSITISMYTDHWKFLFSIAVPYLQIWTAYFHDMLFWIYTSLF